MRGPRIPSPEIGESCERQISDITDLTMVTKPMKKKMKQISDSIFDESPFSEPPDLRNWFPSYVYESPTLDTSDCIKETPIEKETTKSESTIDVCPRLFEHELVYPPKIKDLSQSQPILSESDLDASNCSSYEYQTIRLSADTPEFESSSFEEDLDQLIVEDTDVEEDLIVEETQDVEVDNGRSLFRNTKRLQHTIARMLNSNDYKENIATNKNRTSTANDETEVTSLRNRVDYLEDEVRELKNLINSFVSSNGTYRRD